MFPVWYTGAMDFKQEADEPVLTIENWQELKGLIESLDNICLPSTSPANAAWTMEKLIAAWKVIREIPQDKA